MMTPPEDAIQLNPIGLAFKAGNLHGIMVGHRRMFEDMLGAITTNGIKPLVDKVFPFEAAADAYRTAMAGEFVGKVVIRV